MQVLEWANTLQCKIDAWIEIQHLFFPSLADLHLRTAEVAQGTPSPVHTITLLLLSAIIGHIECNAKTLKYEFELWIVHAYQMLQELQGQLLYRLLMYKAKGRHAFDHHINIKSQSSINQATECINKLVQKYIKNQQAMIQLSGALCLLESWQSELQALNPLTDLSGFTTTDHPAGPGEKKHQLSWIWKGQGGIRDGKLSPVAEDSKMKSWECISNINTTITSPPNQMGKNMGTVAPMAGRVHPLARGDALCIGLLETQARGMEVVRKCMHTS